MGSSAERTHSLTNQNMAKISYIVVLLFCVMALCRAMDETHEEKDLQSLELTNDDRSELGSELESELMRDSNESVCEGAEHCNVEAPKEAEKVRTVTDAYGNVIRQSKRKQDMTLLETLRAFGFFMVPIFTFAFFLTVSTWIDLLRTQRMSHIPPVDDSAVSETAENENGTKWR